MKNYEEIQKVMNSSIGTEGYHVLNLFCRQVVATDGVLATCEFAGCFWLFDVIVSYYPKFRRVQDSFFVITLKVKESSAVFKITHEVYDGESTKNKTVASQKIPFTDLPDGEYKLFMCVQPDDDKNYYVVMCPSEY